MQLIRIRKKESQSGRISSDRIGATGYTDITVRNRRTPLSLFR